jgi:hypothetical protein
MPQRIDREKKTVSAMLRIYCSDQHHPTGDLCPECQELADYALYRLDHCKYGELKSTCKQCASHCYQPAMRERIRQVMRYAGPRMWYRYPRLTWEHILDGFRA